MYKEEVLNKILISEWSTSFFKDWRNIEPKLLTTIYKDFRWLNSKLSELDLDLFTILNLYTHRIPAYVVYSGYVDSGIVIDYRLMIVSELFDIVFNHLIDDLVDGDGNPYILKYGSPRVMASCYLIIYDIVSKYPGFKQYVEVFDETLVKPKNMREYENWLSLIVDKPIDIVLNKVDRKHMFFWKNALKVIKTLDDLKDSDLGIGKEYLSFLKDKYLKEARAKASSVNERLFLNALNNISDIDSILEK